MKVFAIITTFWAFGAVALFIVVSAEATSYGWTAYAPLTDDPGPSLTSRPLPLFMAWLAVMLTITAIGAWIAVGLQLRRRRGTNVVTQM